jgi:hypothetical protein
MKPLNRLYKVGVFESDSFKLTKGFNTVLRGWQLKAMEAVWSSPSGANSRTVHQKVNQALKDETISRASVINFLEDLREMGVFSGQERTGKGGYHGSIIPSWMRLDSSDTSLRR